MGKMEDFRDLIKEEVQGIVDSEFKVTFMETKTVPSIDDPDITYPNLVTKEQKCKLIETCVLYIDIRKSTDLNLSHRRETMAKLYSSFGRAMAKTGGYYGGKVRNIIGDRVMVVFDSDNCFTNAVNTAILMNSVSTYILDKKFPHNEVKCGIGIDYGKMLVTKTGIIKQGTENTSNKSLVWLGRPANVASKLTDIANKTTTETKITRVPTIKEGHSHPNFSQQGLKWKEYTQEHFLKDRVKCNYLTPILKHISESFRCYILDTKIQTSSKTVSTKPILMTKEVYDGYKKANPNAKSVTESWGWKVQSGISVSGYSGDIYGADIVFGEFKK
jgi:adenylate cyclase